MSLWLANNGVDGTTGQEWPGYLRRGRYGFSGASVISGVTLMPMRL
jgi:hypothetical protein